MYPSTHHPHDRVEHLGVGPGSTRALFLATARRMMLAAVCGLMMAMSLIASFAPRHASCGSAHFG
jgi:hypothetical protein